MKGRKPKPAALRTLHNSKRRAHHREEPAIPTDEELQQPQRVVVPLPPGALVKAERSYWSRFAPLLAGAKLLTPADIETLADYCRACAAVEDRSERLRKVLRKRNATPQEIRMFDQQVRGWVERKTKLAAELGLTAVSRTRVAWSGHNQVIDRTQKPKSELARLQEQAATLRKPVAVK